MQEEDGDEFTARQEGSAGSDMTGELICGRKTKHEKEQLRPCSDSQTYRTSRLYQIDFRKSGQPN